MAFTVHKSALALVPLALLAAPPALAEGPSAEDVAQKVEANFRGVAGLRVEADLVLKDASGAERKNTLVQMAGETPEGVRRHLIRFTGPPDLAGTALLTIEIPGGRNQQWLYLGKTDNLKQISEDTWASAFLGSEFTYEDLSFPIASRYQHALLGDCSADGRAGVKLERKPRFEGSAYGRTVTCVDKERNVMLSSEFFDRSGKLVKTATFKEYKAYDTRWRPSEITLTNVQSKRSTVFREKKTDMSLKLSDSIFTTAQLRKH